MGQRQAELVVLTVYNPPKNTISDNTGGETHVLTISTRTIWLFAAATKFTENCWAVIEVSTGRATAKQTTTLPGET